MTYLVQLGHLEDVLKRLSGEDKIYYRSGVWNEYERITLEKLKKHSDLGNGYGYDLFKNEKGEYYVSNPNNSDMW